jgi:hypothetical protein
MQGGTSMRESTIESLMAKYCYGDPESTDSKILTYVDQFLHGLNKLSGLYETGALRELDQQDVLTMLPPLHCQNGLNIYVGEGSELHTLTRRFFPTERILAIPYSYKKRILNFRLLQAYVRNNSIDIVYNYAPVLPVKGVPQVVRSVYSNLYFPEIDFWKDYSVFQRIKKSLIDKMRLKGTFKADGLIFENESIGEIAKKTGKNKEP